MVTILSDHIITPLANSVEGTLQAIRQGRSAISYHTDVHGQQLMEPIMASLLDLTPYQQEGHTTFENLCIACARPAIERSGIDVTSNRCVFVLSTTKGDIWIPTATTARHIAQAFGNQTTPIVVNMACTSGVSAMLIANRMIEAHLYDYAVVIGCDIQIELVVSGFQCVHAVSDKACQPFDKNRHGLNIGEGAAAIVIAMANVNANVNDNANVDVDVDHRWCIKGGSVHNDANHISGPSRTGEGALRCLQDCLELIDPSNLACVSVHGTATDYNDEMESIALHRAELDNAPISALKGYFGHTMGAAGVLETIITMHAIEQGWIPACRGYEQQGTTYAVGVSNHERQTSGQAFIKMLSGFGGVNAAVVVVKATTSQELIAAPLNQRANCASPLLIGVPPLRGKGCKQPIRFNEVILEDKDLMKEYKELGINYPKFYKMDGLSRLGWLATEKLLQEVGTDILDGERTCIIMASKNACLFNNRAFEQTMKDHNNYFPSPALFVYTVPNIVTGEIAIQHKLYGETAFYELDNEKELEPIVQATMATGKFNNAIVGWVEEGEGAHVWVIC